MTQITDIFGETWRVTRRIDSGYGIDMVYGHQPAAASGSTWHLILTKDMEAFVRDHLSTFPQFELPIGQHHKVRLRRLVSSRRYKNLTDWEDHRDPNEGVFWVDPNHIDLPALKDVNDVPFMPVEVRYFQPGFAIWTGIKDTPRRKGERRVREHVLTRELADFLFKAIDLDPKDLNSLGLPLRREAVRRLRLKALAHFKPEMMDYKTDTGIERNRKRYVGHLYMHDDIVMDVLGDPYRVSNIQETRQGDIVMRGRKQNGTRISGAQLIVTPEIATLFDADREFGSMTRIAARLNVNVVTIKRARERLGLKSTMRSKDDWWIARMNDLLDLPLKVFSEKHQCSLAVCSNHRWNARYLLKCARGDGRGPDFIRALDSKMNYKDVAAQFDLKGAKGIALYRIVLRYLKAAKKIKIPKSR